MREECYLDAYMIIYLSSKAILETVSESDIYENDSAGEEICEKIKRASLLYDEINSMLLCMLSWKERYVISEKYKENRILPNKEVAINLKISPNAIQRRISNIRSKFEEKEDGFTQLKELTDEIRCLCKDCS